MNIKNIGSIIGGLICALLIVIDIMASGGNILGRLYLYATIAFFITGVFTPKKSIFLVILLSAYLDHFKRLLVVYGRPTQIDVACIQSLPILLLTGAYIGSFIGLKFGTIRSNKGVWQAFIASSIIAIVGVIPGLIGSGGGGGAELRGIGGAINAGFYAVVIFLIPLHFDCLTSLRKLINFTIVTYIPVALYLLKQAFFGLANFELNYLLTGLSQEARILWEQNALRGFSTMSGASVVSVVLSLFGVAVLHPLRFSNETSSLSNKFIRCSCSVLFFSAAWFTASRGGWFCGLAAAMGIIFFKNKITTVTLYALGFITFLNVILFAPYLHDNRILDEWQITLDKTLKSATGGTSDYLDRAIVLGTFYDRLLGWKNLTQRPDIWTPFGFSAAGKEVNWQKDMIGHDITIDLLVRFGFIPLFGGLVISFFFAYYVHSFIFKLQSDSLHKKIALTSLSMIVGIFFGGFGNGAQLRIFPQNLFFNMFIGIIMACYIFGKSKDSLLIISGNKEIN